MGLCQVVLPGRRVTLLVPKRKLRILDFDIETRLVGFYSAGRFKPNGSEPTALAAALHNVRGIVPFLAIQPEHSVVAILELFAELYDRADVVTGHYIRKFDLPILNGAMLENGLPPLGKKLVQDTKVDLIDFEGLSKSQENLAEMLGIAEAKFKMNDAKWRESTRLRPEGVALTKKRVVQDVKQHMELRQALLDAGALKPPTLWEP